MSESQKIDSLLNEERRFPPSADFQANAIAGPELYEQAAADRLGFWAEQSRNSSTGTPLSPRFSTGRIHPLRNGLPMAT